jgi:hypothetical protein
MKNGLAGRSGVGQAAVAGNVDFVGIVDRAVTGKRFAIRLISSESKKTGCGDRSPVEITKYRREGSPMFEADHSTQIERCFDRVRPGDLTARAEHWACREPLPTRARRWVRGHRTLVAACLALLVSAVVGLAINDRIVRHERDLAERARNRALTAEDHAVKARIGAEAARQEEATPRTLADTNSALARKAVNEMFLYVAEDRFPQVPGVVMVRK